MTCDFSFCRIFGFDTAEDEPSEVFFQYLGVLNGSVGEKKEGKTAASAGICSACCGEVLGIAVNLSFLQAIERTDALTIELAGIVSLDRLRLRYFDCKYFFIQCG